MKTLVQVLSDDERHQVHERTLALLAKTGLRGIQPRDASFSKLQGQR
jgi:hypothetical protein